jgi:SMODS-associated and fused to various effectors sensor domain
VVLRPPGGARDSSIATPEDAVALAVGIRDAARLATPGRRVHLFLAAPIGFAMLLGHRWNRVAPAVVYEDLASLGYEPAFTVSA